MQSERPEYPETKSARRKGIALFWLAMAAPALAEWMGKPEMGVYAFTGCLVAACFYTLTVELDRLHRRVDALRDGD